MSKWRNSIIFVLIIMIALMTIWFNWPSQSSQTVTKQEADCKGEVRAEKGYCAPNFTLPTLDGKQQVELYKNQGKPTIINFWASWCTPCRQEMPDFQQAYLKYKDQVNFLMINEAALEYDEEAAYQYLQDEKYTFPVLLDRPNEQNKTVGASQYGVIGVPFTYVINVDGQIVHKKMGYTSKKELDQWLEEITDK